MKKLLFLLLLMAVPALAKGPKHNFQDPLMNDEMNNIYKDIQFPKISYGSASTMTITQLNVSTLTLSGSLNTASINGTFIGLGRNRILNGDMRIDQKNEGAAYATNVAGGAGPGTAFYALDQWRFEGTGISSFSIIRTNESLPNGMFSQAMRILVTSSGTIGTSDGVNMEYPFDPLYQQDWGWGTTSAVPITLQFWVLSSSAGIYSIAFLNGVNSHGYVSTYTVTSANVWQKEVITVPGDTSGNSSNWPSSGTVFGLKVVWDLGSGTAVKTSNLNSWRISGAWRANGADSFTNTLGAMYFTGIQLEIGSQATAFEYAPYDMELRSLQRYYYKTFNQGTPVGQNKGTNGAITYIVQNIGAGYGVPLRFPIEMLAQPVITFYNTSASNSNWRNLSGGTDSAAGAEVPGITAGAGGLTLYNVQVPGDVVGSALAIHMTANSRLGGS